MLGRSQDATRAALRKYLGIREQGNTADSTANTIMKLETKEEAALVPAALVPAALVPAAAPSAAGDQGTRSSRKAGVEGAGSVGEGRRRERRKRSAVTGLQVEELPLGHLAHPD